MKLDLPLSEVEQNARCNSCRFHRQKSWFHDNERKMWKRVAAPDAPSQGQPILPCIGITKTWDDPLPLHHRDNVDLRSSKKVAFRNDCYLVVPWRNLQCFLPADRSDPTASISASLPSLAAGIGPTRTDRSELARRRRVRAFLSFLVVFEASSLGSIRHREERYMILSFFSILFFTYLSLTHQRSRIRPDPRTSRRILKTFPHTVSSGLLLRTIPEGETERKRVKTRERRNLLHRNRRNVMVLSVLFLDVSVRFFWYVSKRTSRKVSLHVQHVSSNVSEERSCTISNSNRTKNR